MKSFEQQFADWVATMPADERYDFSSCEECALAQGLRAMGYPVLRVGGGYWRDTDDVKHPLGGYLLSALVGWPWTFGALSERLAVAAAEREAA